MELLKNFLLISGFLLLVASLLPIRKLIHPLPQGRNRFLWNILLCLVFIFISGYLIYIIVFWGKVKGTSDLVVPVIFFFGAIFVFLVCKLSLQTTQDLKRIYILEHENTTDSLMGIYNRRYFDRRLKEEFSRSVRYQYPLSLIMVDIDHFKKVNDRLGHQIGDLVLKRLADLLQGSVRDADVVCRYGGEEVAVILPHTPDSSALIVAENLRKKIGTTEILTEDLSPDKHAVIVTASLGVSTLVPKIETADMLLNQADKALYTAKKNGRNCVVSCKEIKGDESC